MPLAVGRIDSRQQAVDTALLPLEEVVLDRKAQEDQSMAGVEVAALDTS